MASLIVGRGHGPGNRDSVLGIAPRAKILPVRVTSPDGYHTRAMDQGIEWAADHGADIISISLSGIDSPYVEDAVNHALDQGAVWGKPGAIRQKKGGCGRSTCRSTTRRTAFPLAP